MTVSNNRHLTLKVVIPYPQNKISTASKRNSNPADRSTDWLTKDSFIHIRLMEAGLLSQQQQKFKKMVGRPTKKIRRRATDARKNKSRLARGVAKLFPIVLQFLFYKTEQHRSDGSCSVVGWVAIAFLTSPTIGRLSCNISWREVHRSKITPYAVGRSQAEQLITTEQHRAQWHKHMAIKKNEMIIATFERTTDTQF